MITLNTLPEATEQEVFNQVYTHLMSQMAKSEDDIGCVYRGPNGTKCAAGCLIADDEYDEMPSYHNTTCWSELVRSKTVSDNCRVLIIALQAVHDQFPPEKWADTLNKVAMDFNLEVPKG